MPGKPTWRLEREAWRSGYRRVAGLDEAGGGCLAGPVVAAAAVPYRPVIGGDRLSVSIAAASIIAKVTRDTYMEEADSRFPGYGFAFHKGYGTRAHLAALRAMGITPLHRRSFSGVGTHQHRLPF